jgi:transcription factor SFP1
MDPLPINARAAGNFKMHTRQPSFSRQWSINSSTIEAAMGWKAGASWADTDMMMDVSPFKSSMSMSPPIATSLARSPDSRMDIEENFCKNYRCCGQDLEDLHELVAHYDAMHAGGSDESTSSMSSSPRSSFSAPGTPGPESTPAPVFADPSQFDSKLNAYASHFPAAANPAPVTPQRVGALTQPLSSVARTSTWQSYFPAADDDEDIFMSDESVMSMRDRNRARSLPDTTKCLSPAVLTTATMPLPSLSARHSVPSLSSNYNMSSQLPTLTVPVPPNIPLPPFASRASVVSLTSSSDDEEEECESSRWTHRSIKAKPTSKPLKEKAYKCPNPECQKSYKNPNGLKYHVTKGTCLVA